jgi:RimJ/RimL family protein N-acetyltransferase
MAEYKLIINNPGYWEFIRELRTMDGIRQGFIAQDEINSIEHAKYMLQYNSNFWICLDDKKPVGYVGVIGDDIRVATHPTYHGKGAATFMIKEIVKSHPNAIAKIKLDNEASIRLFEKCGFKKKFYLLER